MPGAEYEDFELEIGSDLPVGGGPQQYYGRVVRSPAGEAPKSQVKFWFSAPGELAKLRGELENAVLEIDEKNRPGPDDARRAGAAGFRPRGLPQRLHRSAARSSTSTSAARARRRI